MSQKFSLLPLLDIMQERTDEATRKLGKLIAAENNEKSRLQMLENYRQEYSQGLLKAAQNGLSPLTIANYQEFLGRIDEAIESQKKAVVRSKNNSELGKKEWQHQNTKLKAINTLAERHQQRQQKIENKKEQKLLDEFSNRKAATKE